MKPYKDDIDKTTDMIISLCRSIKKNKPNSDKVNGYSRAIEVLASSIRK